MQTYTEFKLTKKADGEEEEKTRLKDYAAKRDAGDEAVTNALNTMSSGELGWSALGAGVGAGGGYLLSRWLRRNGTKGQRALDTLLGALIGGGGTMLLLNTLPGSEGFSPAEQMRLSAMERGKGENNGVTMDTNTNVPPPKKLTMSRVLSTGGGATAGLIGGWKAGAKISDATGFSHHMGVRNSAGLRNPQRVQQAYDTGQFRARNLLGALLGIPTSIFGGWAGNKAYDTLSSVKGEVGS